MRTKFKIAISVLAIILGTFGARAMTSVESGGQAAKPQAPSLCANATWPRIPAICQEGGSGREVRYVVESTDQDQKD